VPISPKYLSTTWALTVLAGGMGVGLRLAAAFYYSPETEPVGYPHAAALLGSIVCMIALALIGNLLRDAAVSFAAVTFWAFLPAAIKLGVADRPDSIITAVWLLGVFALLKLGQGKGAKGAFAMMAGWGAVVGIFSLALGEYGPVSSASGIVGSIRDGVYLTHPVLLLLAISAAFLTEYRRCETRPALLLIVAMGVQILFVLVYAGLCGEPEYPGAEWLPVTALVCLFGAVGFYALARMGAFIITDDYLFNRKYRRIIAGCLLALLVALLFLGPLLQWLG